MKTFQRLLFIPVVLLPAFAWAQQMTFKNHGKIVKAYSMSELAALAPAQTVTVHDPNENADITYRGYPLKIIFDKVYGGDWNKGEEALFTCLDGYQPSVPMEFFHQDDSFLAFERVGSAAFSITNKNENNRKVNVGPYYLIWNGLAGKGIAAGDGSFWAFQLASVDLTTFSETFPRLAPPEESSKSAKRGFLAFRKNCLVCHSINGDGANIGPELNNPVNITEYYDVTFLKKWINDPKSIRFRTAMPALSGDVKNRSQIIDDLVAYLKAMKQRKVKPKGQT